MFDHHRNAAHGHCKAGASLMPSPAIAIFPPSLELTARGTGVIILTFNGFFSKRKTYLIWIRMALKPCHVALDLPFEEETLVEDYYCGRG
jgi:hypothetical protein